MARSTKNLADKGRARFMQLAQEMQLFDIQSPAAVTGDSTSDGSTSSNSSATPDGSS
jgi:hypothetical protein